MQGFRRFDEFWGVKPEVFVVQKQLTLRFLLNVLDLRVTAAYTSSRLTD